MSSPRWFAVLAGLLLAASARTDDPRPAATPATSRHWAFRPPVRVSPPRIAQPQWAQNPIDAFILHPPAAPAMSPSAHTARTTLLRRVSLDLTGLPPTPPELDAFLNDDRPDAYGRAVDRLLASPHFGERWGRHWLDAARYADSHGYSIDAPRSIWPWRDWVVRSLNQDLPFDDFVTDQLAGDLRPDATLDQRVATGFHRNTQINEEGGIDPEQFRIEAVLDRVGTTGTVLLGLTIACAQCHDHKYDPISQREYFRLYAFFNSQDEPSLEVAPVGESAARQGTKPPTTLVLRERSEPRASFVFIKGDFTRRGDDVTPGTPAILPPLTLDPTGPGIDPSTASRAEQTPNRLDLARWLVSPSHPLAARVVVNRIWQQYFGHGLVETENDFGTQGSAPTHPELLDWLATELAGTDPVGSPHRWRLKHLHRLIVTSATYRQRSSAASVAAQTRNREPVDPLNRLLSRQNRIRLEGEVIRDVALAASGRCRCRVGSGRRPRWSSTRGGTVPAPSRPPAGAETPAGRRSPG